MKRVLFIGAIRPPVTGQSLANSEYLDHLVEIGCDVTVFNTNKKTLQSGYFSIQRLFFWVAVYFKVLFQSRKFDSIYITLSQSFLGNLRDILLFIFLNTRLSKTILHLHGGFALLELFRSSKAIGVINKFFLSKVSSMVVLGDSIAIKYKLYLCNCNIFVVHNFFYFADSRVLPSFLPKKKKFRVLFLSNIMASKGYQNLLEASDMAKMADLDVEFVFAGEPENQDSLQMLRSFTERNTDVYYVGTVSGDCKLTLFSEADIFCLPTCYKYEGQPISILEAYATSNAVITTDVGGIKDIFTDGVNGLFVNPGDSFGLFEAIRKIVSSNDLLEMFKSKNSQLAARYTLTSYNAKLDALLRLK